MTKKEPQHGAIVLADDGESASVTLPRSREFRLDQDHRGLVSALKVESADDLVLEVTQNVEADTHTLKATRKAKAEPAAEG